MRISEITYQTNINELLKYDKVEEMTNELETALKKLNTDLIEPLSACIVNQGKGLDLESFYIDEQPLLNEKAINCQNKFEEIMEKGNKLKNQILENARNHREKELTKFINCLKERIEYLESEIARIDSMTTSAPIPGTINIIQKSKLSVLKRKYEAELNGNSTDIGIKDKLEWAQKEIGEDII